MAEKKRVTKPRKKAKPKASSKPKLTTEQLEQSDAYEKAVKRMRIAPLTHKNFEANSIPIGGLTQGNGIQISWQRGPVKARADELENRNGALVSDVLQSAIARLRYYQDTAIKSDQIDAAIIHIVHAIIVLQLREESEPDLGLTNEPDIYRM